MCGYRIRLFTLLTQLLTEQMKRFERKAFGVPFIMECMLLETVKVPGSFWVPLKAAAIGNKGI